jgi:hypothetical protein
MSRGASVAVVCLLACLLAGCGLGDNGIAPPADRIFLPAGAKVNGTSDWLYVVNSNTDLAFNAGTVALIDLRKAAADRREGPWPLCPATVPKLDNEPVRPFCCTDQNDASRLICDERPYIPGASTVHIGSFGTVPVVQPIAPGRERLFVSVRGDPSVTFIDASFAGVLPDLTCAAGTDDDSTCEDAWKVRGGVIGGDGAALPGIEVDLPEEPFALTLDEKLGLLYVGHLSGGPSPGALSLIDACATRTPSLAAVSRLVFPDEQGQAVSAITLLDPGNPGAPVFATGQLSSSISQIFPQVDTADCAAARDLGLVSARSLLVPGFFPRGTDLRGLILQPERGRGFVLHRNTSGDPAALVRVGLRDDLGAATSQLQPTATVEICSGPMMMQLHDAGRGPRIFIPCFESSQVYVVDPEIPAVDAIIDVGAGPASIDFPPDDPTIAYVAGFRDSTVSVIDLAPGSRTEYRTVQLIGFPEVPPR